jgi:hypothetical protein
MACRSNCCNSLARLYGIAGIDEKALRMGVKGLPSVGVFDENHVAVTAILTREDNGAAGGRSNGCTAPGGDINALVKSHSAVNRVFSHTEAGAQLTVYWSLQGYMPEKTFRCVGRRWL